MEISQLIGYVLAVFVGITLGMLGSGGSILSVPILVYVMGIEPTLATAYSLFVIGTTSLVGGIHKAKQKLVDFKKVVLFGIPSVISVFITRKIIVPRIPDVIFSTGSITLHKSVLIMIVFAIVMVVASVGMIKPSKKMIFIDGEKLDYFKIATQGIFIGLISGFVGAGGGFLIIPALVILGKLPMKKAIASSIFIISIKSIVGFVGDISHTSIDWNFLIVIVLLATLGIIIGNYLNKKMDGAKLKKGFGWFVLVMASVIFIEQFFFGK